MSGDRIEPAGENKKFEAKVRDLGLGELDSNPGAREYDAGRKAQDESAIAAARDMAMNAEIDHDAHVQERRGQRATQRRVETERKKTLRQRLILLGTAVALAFGIGGAKAMETRKVAEKEREIPVRGSVVGGEKFENDASGTNAAIKANLENNNNVEGLQGVDVEKSQNEKYNETLKEMNDNDEYPGLELEDRS